MAEVSPMMQHYLQTKEQYKDCILFYRLGDFYEMFFDDAIMVSKELELTLTGKTVDLKKELLCVEYRSRGRLIYQQTRIKRSQGSYL